MSKTQGLDSVSFAENRFYLAMVEASWYGIVLIVLAFACFKIFLSAKTSSNETATTILLLLAIVVVPFLISMVALRIKFTSIRSSEELLISNMWRSYRIKYEFIASISVGNFRPLYRVGPKLRVVIVTFTCDGDREIRSVPIVASCTRGRPSKLLDEVKRISDEGSIPCDIARMIY